MSMNIPDFLVVLASPPPPKKNNIGQIQYTDLNLTFTTLFVKTLSQNGVHRPQHRVDRALGIFSSRPNWDSLTPSPAGESVHPPLVQGGGGGGSQFRRGDRHCSTPGIHVPCGPQH
jgi:hypothetical protein